MEESFPLDELGMDRAFSVSSFTRQCDMPAFVIECVSELRNNPAIPEMRATANDYIERLRNSEWFPLRRLTREIGMEYPEVLRGRGNRHVFFERPEKSTRKAVGYASRDERSIFTPN